MDGVDFKISFINYAHNLFKNAKYTDVYEH